MRWRNIVGVLHRRGVDALVCAGAVLACLVVSEARAFDVHPRVVDDLLRRVLSEVLPPWAPVGSVRAAVVPLAGGALLWWGRRRAPVAVTAVLLLASTVTGLLPAAAVALARVAARRSRRELVALTGLACLPLALALERDRAWAATAALLVAVAVLTGLYLRALREQQDRERTEAARHVRRHEREELAREMHDVLAHRLSLLSLHAGALEVNPGAPREQVARAAAVVRASAVGALEDLQQVLGVLRTEPLAAPADRPEPPRPGIAELPSLLAESEAAGTRIDLHDALAAGTDVPELTGRTVYRIVREALTNARKHAPGRHVRIELSGAPGDAGLSVEITNTLPGPVRPPTAPPLPGSGSGLRGLGERVALVGGELAHGPRDGRFEVRARLPWPA
ncbi:sensor histidine kinase [Streptomyces sp. WAC06614]|uniref:sensor histidine kinase n=1 Tax=Streptomyces sp. WAC06614 TaxID=2487416 RepID=UPI000F7A06D8|nr:sensor histidine kinase [Streptomyces sp. WAC06614]RSS61142.1 sensor histidine kinase [Streptomyces sp. WAC06614]